MPSASITSTIGATTVVGASRNDAVLGSVVTLTSTNAHTTYSWTLAYKPVGSAAAFSGSSTASSPGTFTVDTEGPYLVRLTANLGLSTESTQYVRVRYPTVLGSLDLVAAGEGYGGAIPVPVDQTPTGWTDALNTNFMSVLGLIQGTLTSGRVLTVDPTSGYGDYTTIQAAIGAAVLAGAAATTPFVVKVNPGLYTENLAFQAFVHVIGWPGTPGDFPGFPAILVRGHHTVDLINGSDSTYISDIAFSNIASSTYATMLKTGPGSLMCRRVYLEQTGAGVSQGPAFQLEEGLGILEDCYVVTSSVDDTHSAITQPSQSTLILERSSVIGPTGLTLNTSADSFVVTQLRNTNVIGQAATGTGILSDATALLLWNTEVSSTAAVTVNVHPGAGAFVPDMLVIVRNSTISGDLSFDKTGIVGDSLLELDASSYGDLVYPGGALTAVESLTKGTSLHYDNTTSGLAAENVQDAIDEVHTEAVLVRTLDDAYDGGVPASGTGRTIVADQGSVQIVNAAIPSNPPDAGDTDGRLEVVSSVRVGAIGAPEIDVDPNPYGSGPSIRMGQTVVPNNHPWSTGTARLMARSTGTPLFRNYDFRVQTESSTGGGNLGRLILQGGDGFDFGGIGATPSSVYIQAGSALDAAAAHAGGAIFLIPGMAAGGLPGTVAFANPASLFPATLTALGACANPIGVTGSISFATNMGAVTLNVTATDTRADVVAALDALDGISAAEAGGIITLTTEAVGPNSEIYFLSASAGVDAAIGVFDGVPQVNGGASEYAIFSATDANEISIGVTGVMGPLIYNGNTGKLTVPGIIDPTAVVFEEAPAPGTTATEGAVFVSNGAGGLTAGHFYYQGPSSAAPVDLSIGGGVPTLADVLASGNTTGGTDLLVSAADTLDASAGALVVPTTAAPAQTAEGSVVWDSNDDLLTVGTGASRKTMVDTDSTQTLSGKTLMSPTALLDDANNTSVQDVLTITHTTSGAAGPTIGAGLLFAAENSAGTVSSAARVAGYLDNVGVGTEVGSLGIFTRTGGGALTMRWSVSGLGKLLPTLDNTYGIGDNSNRVSAITSNTFNVFNAAADVNAMYSLDNAGLRAGPGGASALDVTLARASGAARWNMNVALRVGGDVTRNEGAITFGTTRTNAGGGDNVTVQASAAVAAAGSAQAGGQLALYGSNAAATGPGNFSAVGGQVILQAGSSAAINVAQANGANAVVQGGAAASGAGGAAAKGGSVSLLGVAGAGGGNGGDILLQAGALNGGGLDGAVVVSINGAARTPAVLPRASNEGSLGQVATRWGTVAYRDENSSGSKVVGTASKVFGDSPYTVAVTDYVIFYDPSGGNSTVNLPAAASSSGRIVIVKHTSASANSVTVDGNGAETIDGNPTLVLGAYQSATLICNGTGWFIL